MLRAAAYRWCRCSGHERDVPAGSQAPRRRRGNNGIAIAVSQAAAAAGSDDDDEEEDDGGDGDDGGGGGSGGAGPSQPRHAAGAGGASVGKKRSLVAAQGKQQGMQQQQQRGRGGQGKKAVAVKTEDPTTVENPFLEIVVPLLEAGYQFRMTMANAAQHSVPQKRLVSKAWRFEAGCWDCAGGKGMLCGSGELGLAHTTHVTKCGGLLCMHREGNGSRCVLPSH